MTQIADVLIQGTLEDGQILERDIAIQRLGALGYISIQPVVVGSGSVKISLKETNMQATTENFEVWGSSRDVATGISEGMTDIIPVKIYLCRQLRITIQPDSAGTDVFVNLYVVVQ
jgi:hypothetical protein